jgi:activator of 2-hydroxyglutaryl-CoA dehydratase
MTFATSDRGRIKITTPAEPMIAGAVGAALFAFDRAKQKRSLSEPEKIGA